VSISLSSRCTDSAERLAWVSAFTMSGFASVVSRTGKPFNPLLGETFELDCMHDRGWRAVLEQVRWLKLERLGIPTHSCSSCLYAGQPPSSHLRASCRIKRMDILARLFDEQQVPVQTDCFARLPSSRDVPHVSYRMFCEFLGSGKYLEIIPTGISHLIFKNLGDHYTWTKVGRLELSTASPSVTFEISRGGA
jgi:hypothetical protein